LTLFSSAHITVNSRKSAVSIENELNSIGSEKHFGPHAKVQLVNQMKLTEFEQSVEGM